MVDVIGMLLDRIISFVQANVPLLLVTAAVVAGTRTNRGRGLLRRLVRKLPRGIWWPALLSILVSAMLFWQRGEPLPGVEDDYSHLLVADMIRHWRVSSPPHPQWTHFETMLVLQQPRYASQYPPGTGIALAAGWVLFGIPTAGMWIFTALAVACVAWAARGWLPPGWSALCGFLTALHPLVAAAARSYNCGAVALLGGALFVGAVGRMRSRPSQWAGAAGAAGLILLANTRPFEGLVLAAAMIVTNLRAFRRGTATGIAVLLLGALATGTYNRSITGSAFTMPHLLYDRQYNPWPNFFWEAPRPSPEYRNEEMRFQYASWYQGQYRRFSLPGSVADKLYAMAHMFVPVSGGGLSLLFAFPLFLIGRRRSTRPLLIALAFAAAAPLCLVWIVQSQYVAPAGALAAIVYVSLLRDCAARRCGALAAAVLIAALAGSIWTTARSPVRNSPIEVQRRAIAADLARLPGDHLILVPPNVFRCVYNGAVIDSQKVIWARQLGGKADEDLLTYYRARTAWQLSERDGRLQVSRGRGPAARTLSSFPPFPHHLSDIAFPAVDLEIQPAHRSVVDPAGQRLER